MGQKTHPIGFRLGVVKTWNSKWFEQAKYRKWLLEDLQLRRFLRKRLASASIAEVTMERAANKLKINIFSARPGIIIGKRGAGVDQLRKEVQRMTDSEVFLNIQEVRKAEVNAQLVAENICQQLERRIAFRRALKRAVQTAMKFGAKGIRVNAAGRLGNAEMGRREWYREGRVPLHTLRADIDYGFAEARTSAGTIGVKCWIFKGEVLGERAGVDPRFPRGGRAPRS
ncbi:MAG: 30S ribosomal protein S3 [Myxococcales bacterium FL481]|nr:MAG: 30S ribosomal protein S3 [Myxococcales bacterium FL481]